MDQIPRLGKRELICLLLFTFNNLVSVWRGFLFIWVLGMGYIILLWHSLRLPLIILLSVYNIQSRPFWHCYTDNSKMTVTLRTNGPVNAHLASWPGIKTRNFETI